MTLLFFRRTMLAFAPALVQAQDVRTPLVGPFFALAEDGDLLACAIAPAPGEYTLAIEGLEERGRSTWIEATSLRARDNARSDEGLTLHWRLELPESPGYRFEARVEDDRGCPIWKCAPWHLPDGAAASPHMVIASLDGCDAANGWRLASRKPCDWFVVIDDVSALAPNDAGSARAHYRALYLDADLWNASRTPQLFNLPSLDGLQPPSGALGALRRAYREHHALEPSESPWTTEALRRRSANFDMFLVDPTEILAPNSLDAALFGLSASQAPFKLVVKPGRWFDARFAERDLASWNSFLAWLAFHRVTGVLVFGSDPHASGIVEHKTSDAIGYDLIEVVCGPASARNDAAPLPPDPSYMPRSLLSAAIVSVHMSDPWSLQVSLVDPGGVSRFPLDRTANWLRPR
jgi:hypothetical protein